MTDFNQKTHDTDVGSHGGQSRQMMILLFYNALKIRGLLNKLEGGILYV